MSDAPLPLAITQLEQVGRYVKDHLNGWLAEVAGHLTVGPQILEHVAEIDKRGVRIEEELKHQRELRVAGFAASDKRFEDVNRRFEDVNQRFEETTANMNKRFNEGRWMLGGAVVILTALMSLYRFRNC